MFGLLRKPKPTKFNAIHQLRIHFPTATDNDWEKMHAALRDGKTFTINGPMETDTDGPQVDSIIFVFKQPT